MSPTRSSANREPPVYYRPCCHSGERDDARDEEKIRILWEGSPFHRIGRNFQKEGEGFQTLANLRVIDVQISANRGTGCNPRATGIALGERRPRVRRGR